VKRFEFSLDRLLRVKRQLERVAELEQQKAQDAVAQARAVLDGYRDQLLRVSDQFAACVGRAMTPHQWSSAAELAERLGRSIADQEQEVARAEARLLAAAQERAQVATEVEAISTLKRQQWDQWKQEAQKADQDRLDEVGLRQWMSALEEREAARDADSTEPPATEAVA